MATIHTITNEARRGCGYREPGGFYLMGDKMARPCGGLPIPLVSCPCCGGGFKVSRTMAPFNPRRLFSVLRDPAYQTETGVSVPETPCNIGELGEVAGVSIQWGRPCESCPVSNPPEVGGLLWIGKRSYSVDEFTQEAMNLGISRRLNRGSLPDWLKIGETHIYLAHIEAVIADCPVCKGAGSVHSETREPMTNKDADGPYCEECEKCMGKATAQQPGIFGTFIPTHAEYVMRGDETEAELDAIEERGFKIIRLKRTDGEGKETQKPGLLGRIKSKIGGGA